MLDLMTLGFSMGMQQELQSVRKETGAQVHNGTEQVQESSPSMVSMIAENVESALTAVENAATSICEAMMPSGEGIAQVVESVQAPVLDLSLPTKLRLAQK
ncbi:unnamed protein product [Amoebophrya sp. A25]|nr:unnamed protein product [Amoebophrya sp. A25]|eukprot:GSA25T00003011001.1